MQPDPGTIVPITRAVSLSGQDWWGDAIALAQHGEDLIYLIVHGEGAPQWVASADIEKSSIKH